MRYRIIKQYKNVNAKEDKAISIKYIIQQKKWYGWSSLRNDGISVPNKYVKEFDTFDEAILTMLILFKSFNNTFNMIQNGCEFKINFYSTDLGPG